MASPTRPGCTGGLMLMRSVTPTTPRTWRTIRSTSRRWNAYVTVPSSVTQPYSTLARTWPCGIWTLLSGTSAIALAISPSSRGVPGSWTFRSLAPSLAGQHARSCRIPLTDTVHLFGGREALQAVQLDKRLPNPLQLRVIRPKEGQKVKRSAEDDVTQLALAVG
jgi:hypothetical protein